MAQQRKQQRRIRALARFPQSSQSRKGKRTEAQWEAERVRLTQLIGNDRATS